jgi:hypothetical protein
VDKTIKRFTSLQSMKAAEYEAWQAISARDRLAAAMDISIALYGLKGLAPSVRRLQGSAVRVQRRIVVNISDGLVVPLISRADLVTAKIAAGRPQDLADVAALRDSAEHEDEQKNR